MSIQRTRRISLAVGAVVALVLVVYCFTRPAAKPVAVSRTYTLTGVVVQVMSQTKKISVANDDIPGLMQPMVMEYGLADPSALSNLRRGDEIRATLRSDGAQQWVLQDISVGNRH